MSKMSYSWKNHRHPIFITKINESWSLIEPPGWTIEFILFACDISTQSENGKKASLAKQDSFRSKPNFLDFSIAWFNASILILVPFQIQLIVCFYNCYTIDLYVLQ